MSNTSQHPWRLFVVCRSEQTAELWRHRSKKLAGLVIQTILNATSYYQVLNDLLTSGLDTPVVVCHDDITCGFDFADALDALVSDLDRAYFRWGICGNAGIGIDGRYVVRHIRDPHGGPDPGLGLEPVLSIDGNLMLLNLPALRKANVHLPTLAGFQGYDIALSLECWLAGLPVLCDPRLFVMHHSAGNLQAFQAFCWSNPFQSYLAQRVVNHMLPTINGPIDLSGAQDFGYLDLMREANSRSDFAAAFDRSLAASRRCRPHLTIVCRTRLDRPELLERAMMSFAAAAIEAPELVDIDVLLTSDQPLPDLLACADALRQRLPALPIEICHASRSPYRYSRVAALIAAIEQCRSDYVWFVDDDDFVYPAAIRPIARALLPWAPRLVVGTARRFEELWSTSPSCKTRSLKNYVEVERIPAESVFHAFSGDNFTPICSAIYPTQVLKERLEHVAARGDYYEDYYLLLLALTSPRIEVYCTDTDICGISLRTGENTVTLPDREHWNLSYATFMNELMRCQHATSPLLWQLSRRSHRTSIYPHALYRAKVWKRLSPRLWPLLLKRLIVSLRHAGWRATWQRARKYLQH